MYTAETDRANPKIRIPQGVLEGFHLESRKKRLYFGFYGIPYGKAERFELPSRWESWNGVLVANRARERCIQVNTFTRKVIGSEDCHFLNVFTPEFQVNDENDVKNASPLVPTEKFPVIVFFHGGGFYAGGGDLYGNKFLVDEDVILVTVNFRLGALGFLNTGDGIANLGLHDQVMALRWVQENIEYFAGDKDNVTIMGNSAGAACVHFHMLSPLSTGLFSKAIMQSGNALSPWAFNRSPAEKVKKLLKQMDMNGYSNTSKTEIITKLKKLDARAIAAQSLDFESVKGDYPPIHFAPSIESGPRNTEKFLTEEPLQLLYNGKNITNEVPLILGINEKEGLYRSLPILRDAARLKALNEHWAQELPKHLMYKKESLHHHEEFVKGVRHFYFDSKPIVQADSIDARERLTNMISDRLFIFPTRKTALIHRSLNKDPTNKIYLYKFSFTSDYSYCNGFDVRATYGASHADELQYLMNQRIFYSKIGPGTPADEMIEKMVRLWANFARTGVPAYPGQINEWVPVPLKHEVQDDTLEYFNIDKQDSMVIEPFTERMNFWDHVPNLSLSF